MKKNLLINAVKNEPDSEEHRYIFITDREGLARNLSMGGYNTLLLKDKEGYFKSPEAFEDWAAMPGADCRSKYVYVLCCSKDDNDFLKDSLENLLFDYKPGWHLFRSHGLDRQERAAFEKVWEIADNFVEDNRIPALDQVESREFKPVMSAADLQDLELPPVSWIVKDLLPEGLAIFSGPPKTYKSFMAIDLALSVASGRPFMGYQTVKGAVLYCDLESTKRRPKDRINKVLGDRKAPDNFYIATQEDKPGQLDNGYLEYLEYQLLQHPEIKLIITDVYQKIRPPAKKGKGFYEKDYEDGVALQSFALKHKICMLVIHHNSKKDFPGDPFNQMSGSTGLSGSADTMIVLTKDKRFEKKTRMSVTGREIKPEEFVISFNDSIFRWELEGTAQEVEAQLLFEEFDQSPIVSTVRKLIKTNDGEWTGTAQEIVKASYYFGCQIYEDPRQIGKLLLKYENLLEGVDGITVSRDRTGKDRTRVITLKKIG